MGDRANILVRENKESKRNATTAVYIRSENHGWDISVKDANDQTIQTTWRYMRTEAVSVARIWADYYRDDNGQAASIITLPNGLC